MKTVKKMIALLVVFALLLCTAACGANESAQPSGNPGTTTKAPETDPPAPRKVQAADLLEAFTARQVEDKATDDTFTAAAFDWAAKLFSQVYAGEGEQKTLLVSPLSVLIALAMTANGAKGETLKEMEQVLGGLGIDDLNAYLRTYLKSLPSSELAKFAFANAIWFKDDPDFLVEDEFLQKVVDYYDAAVRKAPFDDTTVQEINQWVALHTDDMIEKLLEELKDSDRMVLVNALVFDAKWQVPFLEEECREDVFTGLDGRKGTATFMSQEIHSYIESDEAIGFTKSYKDDTYRFVALLPKDEEGFEDFVKGLTGEKLAALLNSENGDRTIIRMPKFSYDYDTSLVSVLEAMGMKKAFTDRADFSGISTSEALCIGDVLHKTHIDLDSEGTRAAAVTAVMMVSATAVMQPPHRVTLDRPFVYMIVDSATNLPVFMGTVTGFNE
nr:serpin family protein [Lachnospiraceae bacterium]